ncbi:PREDICTED: E3 ubiquitin-protein ligase TTC3-like [Elephantulus edwardii]|uniref:E3 ubiquitin-protein ligase TTC3-like n=1 Tax=Elephantulus edwardii TaxID=28737 RepID=UPI0003F0CE58|nr:PREDICTED: E3 ubiquitin-protein ligase TTC3-like [Elephantulus edwardii]
MRFVGDVTLLTKLGSLENCWPMLSIFFTEYKYHITKIVTEDYDLLEEFNTPDCAGCTEQGEIMKIRGNEEFSKDRFHLAIIYYTKAMEYRPENHLLYGNRALCFLRTGQFRSALGDGKRAIILKNTWPKGHYRYCDALSLLGEYDWALKANLKAQELCRHNPEGLKDLTQQCLKFQRQIDELQARQSVSLSVTFTTSLNFVDTTKGCTQTTYEMACGGKRTRKFSPFPPLPTGKPSRRGGRRRSRNSATAEAYVFSLTSHVTINLKNILERQFSKSTRAAHQDFVTLMKLLRGLMQDGYTALSDRRCHCAVQAFTLLLNGLDPQKIKQKNLTMINCVLVVYGLGLSLLGIGKPEELAEAEKQFRRILSLCPSEGLDCLAYCGIGSVYLKENSFAEALIHFQAARNVIDHLPGILSWPTRNVIIDSRPSKLKELLEKFIEECRFPPEPEGICSYHQHCTSVKIQIYISDPDFKGFVRLLCSQICKVEFHMNCWKKLKALNFGDKQDKDFLNTGCLTPDCQGIICKITVINCKGRIKCEFEHKVIKEKFPPRPILKQKCSSLEKLKEKEEKKLMRKLQKEKAKQSVKQKQEEDLRENNPPKNDKKAPESVCQSFGDRLLECIKQHSEKIKSGIFNTSLLMKELLSWKVLSMDDYTTCFSSRNFLSEAVDFVIQHLINENNKVKTRIFLHVLSELKEMDPDMATWVGKLNGFGLTAAVPFLTRHKASFKNLDFTTISFLWNEKYSQKLSSISGKKFDYFCEPAASKEARCLIWLLEDHREKFPALHSALDEFFDILDSSCTVLRKQEHDDMKFVSAKVKNKGKKKKPKDLKPMLVGSGTTSIIKSLKSETVTKGGNNNSGSSHPFTVTEHLQKDVEFEVYYQKKQEQQNQDHASQSKMSDRNPKQRCSTLYDYFSEYLEDNGPLNIRHKVFSDEYQFFPEETQRIVQKAGGLKEFLLKCPRFVVIDNCIALKKVSTHAKRKGKKKTIKEEVNGLSHIDDDKYLPYFMSLNPDAEEFTPESVLSSAPASQDGIPEAASMDSPNSAYKDGESALASEGFSRLVSRDGELRWVPCDSPHPVSGAVDHPKVFPDIPNPVSEDMERNDCAQPQMVTGYYTYIPFQAYDITQIPPAYISVLPSVPQYAGIYTPLADISEYQLQRGIPVVPSFVPHRSPDPSAAVYFEGHHGNSVNACGNQMSSKAQIQQGCLGASPKPLSYRPHAAGTAHSEVSGKDSQSGKPHSKEEGNRIRTKAVSVHPPTQTTAVQVTWSVAHQEVNTDPYAHFETEPGDISRIEKEYRKLQEQLENAYENFEQTRFQGLAAIRDLEENVRRNVELSEISKVELEWLTQDLEKETKQWQQQKKENQEKLKALKKKVKRLHTASETCTQKNDEKDEEHGLHLDESLEIRNRFANEKAKLQESIKKGKEDYEKARERLIDAEVSVLECWKEMHVWNLEVTQAKGKSYIEFLKKHASNVDPALVEAVLHEWEMYFSWTKEELETADLWLEGKVEEAKSGATIMEIDRMLSLPVFENYCPESLGSDGRQTADSKDAGVAPEHASAEQSEVARLLACAKKSVQEAQSKQNPVAGQKGQASRSNQSLRKPFNTIIEHLAAVFPGYSSSELAGFVKKVRTKSSLLGLSIDETVGRVIEHILAEQKKKPNPGTDQRTSEPSPAAPETMSLGVQPSVPATTLPKPQGQRPEGESAVSLCGWRVTLA